MNSVVWLGRMFLMVFRFLGCFLVFCFFPLWVYGLGVGDRVPGFVLRDCYGRLWRSSDFCGEGVGVRVWVVDFFSSSCEPCKRALSVLVGLEGRYGGRGLRVVLVSFRERERVVREFVEGAGVRFPVLMDKYGEVARVFGVYGLPRTFVVEGGCVVRGQIIGEREDFGRVLEGEVLGLLGE